MDIHGIPWISMAYHGYPWHTMDIHGRDISTMDGEDIIQKRLLGEDIIQKTVSWRRLHPKNDILEKTSAKNIDFRGVFTVRSQKY